MSGALKPKRLDSNPQEQQNPLDGTMDAVHEFLLPIVMAGTGAGCALDELHRRVVVLFSAVYSSVADNFEARDATERYNDLRLGIPALTVKAITNAMRRDTLFPGTLLDSICSAFNLLMDRLDRTRIPPTERVEVAACTLTAKLHGEVVRLAHKLGNVSTRAMERAARAEARKFRFKELQLMMLQEGQKDIVAVIGRTTLSRTLRMDPGTLRRYFRGDFDDDSTIVISMEKVLSRDRPLVLTEREREQATRREMPMPTGK
jgi:hypothetical protein